MNSQVTMFNTNNFKFLDSFKRNFADNIFKNNKI